MDEWMVQVNSQENWDDLKTSSLTRAIALWPGTWVGASQKQPALWGINQEPATHGFTSPTQAMVSGLDQQKKNLMIVRRPHRLVRFPG